MRAIEPERLIFGLLNIEYLMSRFLGHTDRWKHLEADRRIPM